MPVLRIKLAEAAATPKGEPSGSRSLRLRADQSQDSGVGALSRRPASGASRVGRLVSSPGGFAPMLILGKRWRFLPIDVLHIFLWQHVRSCFNQRFPRSGGEVWGAADRRCHVSGYRCIVFSAPVSGRRPRQTRHFVIMEPEFSSRGAASPRDVEASPAGRKDGERDGGDRKHAL